MLDSSSFTRGTRFVCRPAFVKTRTNSEHAAFVGGQLRCAGRAVTCGNGSIAFRNGTIALNRSSLPKNGLEVAQFSISREFRPSARVGHCCVCAFVSGRAEPDGRTTRANEIDLARILCRDHPAALAGGSRARHVRGQQRRRIEVSGPAAPPWGRLKRLFWRRPRASVRRCGTLASG